MALSVKINLPSRKSLLTFVSFIFFIFFHLPSKASDIPIIAAAANIKFALDDIAHSFAEDTGKKVRISYGSSGNFVAQIQHGAPFELFLSADSRYIEQLHKAGIIAHDGTLYAIGKLALVRPKNAAWQLDSRFIGLKKALAENKIKRFAIANPEHAPYGNRAEHLLKDMHVWQSIAPKLIYGENVSQAAQFALSGSTQGGIVALSLALAPQFKARSEYIEIPDNLYKPLEQRMTLLPNANKTAGLFFNYLQSHKARDIFKHYGFGLPV